MASVRSGTENTVGAALNVRSSAERLKSQSVAMKRTVDDFVRHLREL